MKPIQLKKTVIDIPFMDEKGKEALVLHFDQSDEKIKRLYDSFDEIQSIAKKLEKEESDNFEEIKDFLKKAIDSIFGEGSFDQLYAISPSIQIVAVYFAQMAIGIKEELEQEDIKSIEKKYLK